MCIIETRYTIHCFFIILVSSHNIHFIILLMHYTEIKSQEVLTLWHFDALFLGERQQLQQLHFDQYCGIFALHY